MSETLGFRRLGSEALSAWPWNPGDVVQTKGMKPLGQKEVEKGGMVAGTWACNAGKVQINGHPVNEACFVIRGSVTITDESGNMETFKAGEGFFLPHGFRGLWSNSDDFAKLFVAVEDRG
jgi:uncharacterized protein